MNSENEEIKNEQPNVENEEIKDQKLSEVDILQAKIAELTDQNLRAIAENQNIVRRLKNETADMVKHAISKFASELIDPIEVLFLALDNIPDDQKENSNEHFKSLHQGVDMTKSEFLKAFEKHGMHRIYPIGEKFDHNFHQAVSQIKDEKTEAGMVLQVLKAGYSLHGRVLRPAIVVVSS